MDTRNASVSSEDGFHEIHLSGKQLVFLFMATTVVSIVIFLCGVLVGRGVRTEASTTGLAQAPATDAVAQVPDAAAGGGSQATNVAASELSYYERLGNPEPPADAVKSGTEVPEPAERSSQPPAAGSTGGEGAAAPEAEGEPARAVTDAPASADGASLPAARVAGGWAVQVAAVRQKTEADAIAARLVRKGYDAYVVAPLPGGSTPMYRVRVGSYQDRGDAEQMMRRLIEQERFKPWITR